MSTNKIVPIRAGILMADTARDRYIADYMDGVDIEELVQDSQIRRHELRCVEDQDDEVQQCIETRLAKLLGVDWRLDGGNVGSNKKVTAVIYKMYTDLITGAWRSSLYGYSVMELIWAPDGNFFYPKQAIEKPFEWFNVDRLGALYYRGEYSYTSNVSMLGVPVNTAFKFLLTRHKPTYTRPRGRALLAVLFWPTFYRYATWKFWMQFLERSGQPMIWGKGNNPTQVAEQLRKGLMDAVIAVPADGEVGMIGGSSKGDPFDKVEAALIRRIQKVLLGQTLTSDTGTNGNGSKALGEVHNEVRNDKTTADCELVRPTIQTVVDAIYALNFPGQEVPKFRFAIEQGLETGRATRDATLINTGNVEMTEEYYIREYGFQKGDIKVISPSKAKKDAAAVSDQNKNKDPAPDNTSNNKDGAN